VVSLPPFADGQRLTIQARTIYVSHANIDLLRRRGIDACCNALATLVELRLNRVPGILSATVNLETTPNRDLATRSISIVSFATAIEPAARRAGIRAGLAGMRTATYRTMQRRPCAALHSPLGTTRQEHK